MQMIRYKLISFYLDGRLQTPKDLDFIIIPTIVIGRADKAEVGDLGFAYGIGIKWGYWAVGLKLFGVYL
jgi:hypothetical protein